MGIQRVGVVGCGRNSDHHLSVYARTKGCQLVAVCDVDRERVEKKARVYQVDQAFRDYNSMLDLDLDLVDIVTPTPTHAEIAVRALESGHNVLVEKPMALTAAECIGMIDASHRNEKTLCVVHNELFFDAVVRARATLDQEGLNPSRMRVTQYVTVPYEGYKPAWVLREDSGGILWETAVHHIYLIQHFMGEVESVSANAYKVREQVYDSFTLLLQCRKGLGVSECQWNVKESLSRFQVVTEQGDRFDGDLSHDFVVRKSRSYKNGRTTALRSMYDDFHEPFTKWSEHARRIRETGSLLEALPYEHTFFVLIRQLLSHLDGRRDSPPVTPREGVRAVSVLEAAEKSIESGKTQSVEYLL